MTYPFNRVSAGTLGFGGTNRKDTFFDDSEEDSNFRDRFFLSSIQYDTVTGRYLVPTKGQRLNLFYQQGFEKLTGNQTYKTAGVEGTAYIPIQRESTIASRLFFGRSTGPERQVFRLGGIDRVRALAAGSEANKKSNVALGSVEARLRLKYLNARTGFLFPDFFFKAAYFIAFNDAGYAWDNAEERNAFQTNKIDNSAGVGISWPTFILQSFQMNLTIQWAHRTNTGTDIWYISVGPSF
jgi:hypothetical protein